MSTHAEPHPNPQSDGLVQVVVHSVGILHEDALALLTAGSGGLVFNIATDEARDRLHDPAMRELTGLDPAVREHVLSTPGIMPKVEQIAASARGVLTAWADHRRWIVHVTVACKEGRHHSVAVAEAAAAYLRGDGIGADVQHHHISRPMGRS
ncbi:hypothetical protein [Kitasatospora sp. NPDC088134]|uniref:RapZ C-terminal domain-containing protein n=1 Tax=Kitasatospora sp. NPDC088134 TaxID=3364071 RepID=UPI0037F4A957